MTSMVTFDSKVGGSNTLGSLNMSLEFSLQYNSTLGIFVSFEWWTMDELTSKTPIFYAIVKKETTLRILSFAMTMKALQLPLIRVNNNNSLTLRKQKWKRDPKKRKKKESQKKKSPHLACVWSEWTKRKHFLRLLKFQVFGSCFYRKT